MPEYKYKFVETQGCTAFGFTVNDKDLNDITKAEQITTNPPQISTKLAL